MVEESLPDNDPKQRKPSIELARKYLNWHPTVSLKQGLVPTIDSLSTLLKII